MIFDIFYVSYNANVYKLYDIDKKIVEKSLYLR